MAQLRSRFHGQLMHVRECLEQATLRTIYCTPYDGEVAVDPGKIALGGVPVWTGNVWRVNHKSISKI